MLLEAIKLDLGMLDILEWAPEISYICTTMIDVVISKLESETGENLMVTEIVGPKQIAEVVSWWTVTRLSHNDKERLVVLADRLH